MLSREGPSGGPGRRERPVGAPELWEGDEMGDVMDDVTDDVSRDKALAHVRAMLN